MTTTEELLVEIRDEVREMRKERDEIPIVNRLSQIIDLLEHMAGVVDEDEDEKNPRIF